MAEFSLIVRLRYGAQLTDDADAAKLMEEAADALDKPRCVNPPGRTARDILDGGVLCQECCDNWARGEQTE